MKRVRFYDDNQKYLQMDDNIKHIVDTVWVRPEPIVSPFNPNKLLKDQGEYVRFLKSRHSGWDLLGADRDLSELLEVLGTNTSEVALTFGLNETHLSDLRNFAKELPDEPNGRARGVVIFDWDEVLNSAEGFRRLEQIQPSAHLKFAMGTHQRLLNIRSCINDLVENQIDVHIATNNTACDTSLYRSITRALHPAIRVHCCRAKKYSSKSECIRLENMIPSHLMNPVRDPSSFGGTRTFKNRVRLI